MKKKLLTIIIASLAVAACAFALAGCVHKHNYAESVIEPTCTEQGYTSHTCDCGENYKDNLVDATGHDFTKEEAEERYLKSPASCTEKAVYYKSCAGCGEKGTETFEYGTTAPHTYTQDKAEAEYFKSAATCTKKAVYYKSCTVCGKKGTGTFEYGELTEHSWEDNVCKTCKFDAGGSKGLRYSIDMEETHYSLFDVGYCTDKKIIIPSTYNGLPVTAIEGSAFGNCSSLQSITIPDSVTYVDFGAFTGCTGIIQEENNVYYVDKWVIDCDSFRSGTLRSDTKGIANDAFFGCHWENITIPDSVTAIGDEAFGECTNLTSITIPENVIFIGSSVFKNCSKLTNITVDRKNVKYHDTGNCIIETSTKKLIAGCNNSIIPTDGSVTSIGDGAFNGCSSLQSINIPNSVTAIDRYAFFNCVSLTSITIPDSVTSIGGSAFGYCNKIIQEENNVSYVDKWVIDCNKYVKSVTLRDDTRGIANYVFNDCGILQSITLPDSVTYIGDFAFCRCKELTNITLPNNVTYIGKGAFRECSKLTNMSIPDKVTYIGDFAFYSCSELQSITIPNSVTSIGMYAFNGCSSLQSINIPNSVTAISPHAFRNCSGLISVIIPEGVTSIGDFAFYRCSSLQSITIPDSVTSIGDFAFSNCSSLQSITIPDSVTNIGIYAFYGCLGSTSITFQGTKEQWKAINKDSIWNIASGNYTVICTDGKLDKDGNEITE